MKTLSRKNSNSLKWRKYANQDVIPLWIADMDFQCPQAVVWAIQQRLKHPIFGYDGVPERATEAVVESLWRKYKWKVERQSVIWLPSIVPVLFLFGEKWLKFGDEGIVFTPIYPPFLWGTQDSLARVHRLDLEVPSAGFATLPMNELRRRLSDKTKIVFLCNPHNPVGRAFSLKELKEFGKEVMKTNSIIVSDEIHCDLILKQGLKHIPLATVSKELAARTITLMSTTKTFNLPGVAGGFAIVTNSELQKKFLEMVIHRLSWPHSFSLLSSAAALRQGNGWLHSTLKTLRRNLAMAKSQLSDLPKIQIFWPEATYLLWIDVRALNLLSPVSYFESYGLGFSDGADFGAAGYVRWNFASTLRVHQLALQRFRKAVIDQLDRIGGFG